MSKGVALAMLWGTLMGVVAALFYALCVKIVVSLATPAPTSRAEFEANELNALPDSFFQAAPAPEFEDDSDFGVELGAVEFEATQPLGMVLHHAAQPLPVYLNGTRIQLRAPDTLYLGTGDVVFYRPNKYANIGFFAL